MDSKRPFAFQCSSLIEDEGYKCALVGGVAVGVWTEERFTKDIDLALAVKTDKDAENLVKRLLRKGFIVEKVLEHKPTESLAVVILSHTINGKPESRLDLIFKQTGIEREVVENAVMFKIDNRSEFRVATVGHLIALKTLSMDDQTRPQDRQDLANLFKVADRKDLELAKKAVKLITGRGFNQDKNLTTNLKLLQEMYGLKKSGQKIRR